MKKEYKCVWCRQKATKKNWREIDGTTSSMLECDKCFELDTEYLNKKYSPEKNIVITIQGGCVVDVKGLPKDWTYEIEDLD